MRPTNLFFKAVMALLISSSATAYAADASKREAASIPNTPSGTVYHVNGKPLTEPLGLMEHWNNAQDRHYDAIDLVYRKID
ncbi:MAG: hypothetical protein K2M16_06385 [Muribaculaceae bacterium]|nr:hypothetical protein [Muribaculaceae bacterium]